MGARTSDPSRPLVSDQGVSVRRMVRSDVPTVVNIHKKLFPDYLSTKLGGRFLRTFYREFVVSADGMGFVAVSGLSVSHAGTIVGFLVGCPDDGRFYGALFRNNVFQIAAVVIWKLFSRNVRPIVWARRGLVPNSIRFAARRPTRPSSTSKEPIARLILVGVIKEFQGGPAASALVQSFLEELRQHKVREVGLTTYLSNSRAIAYYEKSGWRRGIPTGESVTFTKSTGLEPLALDVMLHERGRVQREYQRRDANPRLRGRYSVGNQAVVFTTQQRDQALAAILSRTVGTQLHGMRVLDVGCGSGGELTRMTRFGVSLSDLCGIDLSPTRLLTAKRSNGESAFIQADASALPFRDGSFDLIMQMTTFTSILDERTRVLAAREMVRVLRQPTGLIIWYDFWIGGRPSANQGLGPGEIRRLFPNMSMELSKTTLFFPIAQLVAPVSPRLAKVLARAPVLRSHYLAILRPEPSPE